MYILVTIQIPFGIITVYFQVFKTVFLDITANVDLY